MSLQYVGSKISLTTKSGIRYEGILHSVEPETSTISLHNVRTFGTEGRAKYPAQEQPPTNDIYEFITFKGPDIEDLSVLEQKPPAAATPSAPAPQAAAPERQERKGRGRKGDGYGKDDGYGKGRKEGAKEAPRAEKGDANKGKGRRHMPVGELMPTGETVKFEGEFDLNKAHFEKEAQPDAKPAYNPMNFFDNMSCDARDRAEGGRQRVDRDKARAQDAETFGEGARKPPRAGGHRRYGKGKGKGKGNRY